MKNSLFIAVMATTQPTVFQIATQNTIIDVDDKSIRIGVGELVLKTRSTEANPLFQDVEITVADYTGIKFTVTNAAFRSDLEEIYSSNPEKQMLGMAALPQDVTEKLLRNTWVLNHYVKVENLK